MNNHSNTLIKRLFLIMLFFMSWAHSAEISTSIDRNPVRVNETFELTLHMDSAPINKPPLEGLSDVFEIVRSSNFYQRSTINGTTEIQAGWRYVLKATEEGIFTIPSFNIEGETTKAFQVSVLPPVSSTKIGEQPDAIKLTATVDNDEVYVQQQILYTLRLYRAVQAQYASLTDPIMEGAIIERLGEDKQFESEIDGVRYIVLERRYAIFPQTDGIQTISPIIFTAEVSDGSKRYSTFGQLRSRTKAISLSTEKIAVNVNGRPKGELDWWLPAIDLTLTEQWSPEPVEFRVGEPVTWSYTIKASGLTSTQLPELLPTSVDGLKFYPDIATNDNQSDQFGITGLRTQKVAVLPTKAGTLTLPELNLTWWDIKANKAQIINIPSREINVLPSLNDNSATQPSIEIKAGEPETQEVMTQNETSTTNNEISTEIVQPWKMIAIISLLLWVISALILTLRNKQPSKLSLMKKAAKNIKNESSFKKIKIACKAHSAQMTKDAILNWCASEKSLSNIHSIAELARHSETEALKTELYKLERSLYSKETANWNGDGLAKQLIHLQSMNKSNIKGNTKSKDLPPLHLSGG